MSDIVDDTQDRLEREMAQLIDAARRQPVEASEAPAGECFNNCGDAPLPGGNYCSSECAADAHARKVLRKRQGARP